MKEGTLTLLSTGKGEIRSSLISLELRDSGICCHRGRFDRFCAIMRRNEKSGLGSFGLISDIFECILLLASQVLSLSVLSCQPTELWPKYLYKYKTYIEFLLVRLYEKKNFRFLIDTLSIFCFSITRAL